MCVEVVRQSGTVPSCCYETAGMTRGGEREHGRERERERERGLAGPAIHFPSARFSLEANFRLELKNNHQINMVFEALCLYNDRFKEQRGTFETRLSCQTVTQICHICISFFSHCQLIFVIKCSMSYGPIHYVSLSSENNLVLFTITKYI